MSNYPSELKYTKDHEWLRNNGDGTATIGVTEFAQSELGDIVFVEINEMGSIVNKDEIFGTVEAVKTVSELFMPINAELLEINDQLESNPELVNQDPYGDGWMVKIKILDESQIDDLLDADGYQEIIA
jgi:glycine cleavage system H protein